MEKSDEERLKELEDSISESLVEVENILERNNRKHDYSINIRIPGGFVRSCDYFRDKYGNLADGNLLDNISYSLQLTDIYRYFLNRFQIYGSVQSMIVKNGIVVVNSILEASIDNYIRKNRYNIKKEYGINISPGNPKTYSKKLERLNNIFEENIISNLEKVNDMRKKIHLNLVDGKEYNNYTLEHYNYAISVLQELNSYLSS